MWVFRSTAESFVAGWEKKKYIFRLGFKRPDDIRNPGRGQYPTVYQPTITTK